MGDEDEPKKIEDDMYPIVVEALRELNGGKGAKIKQILCYVRDNHNPDLEDGDLNCSVRGALRKGICKKAIKKTLFGKYKLTLRCLNKKKCPPKKPTCPTKKSTCPTKKPTCPPKEPTCPPTCPPKKSTCPKKKSCPSSSSTSSSSSSDAPCPPKKKTC